MTTSAVLAISVTRTVLLDWQYQSRLNIYCGSHIGSSLIHGLACRADPASKAAPTYRWSSPPPGRSILITSVRPEFGRTMVQPILGLNLKLECLAMRPLIYSFDHEHGLECAHSRFFILLWLVWKSLCFHQMYVYPIPQVFVILG